MIKDKAKELVDKFNLNNRKYEAKQCALISINETIEALEHNSWQNRDWIKYYTEVKQEIEKL